MHYSAGSNVKLGCEFNVVFWIWFHVKGFTCTHRDGQSVFSLTDCHMVLLSVLCYSDFIRYIQSDIGTYRHRDRQTDIGTD